MLPDNKLSTLPSQGSFIGGRSAPVTGQLDYEMGPIAIQDSSEGIQYQLWSSRLENGLVYIKAQNTPEYVFLNLPNVTEMSFSFDHSANIVFVYVQAGVTNMYWWDSSLSKYVTTSYGGDAVTPRVAHDDKRELQSGVSDVIFAYVHIDSRGADGKPRTASLRYRQQRERYEVERTLATNITDGLVKIGMMRNLRVGFQLKQKSGAVVVGSGEVVVPDDDVISLIHFDSLAGGVIVDSKGGEVVLNNQNSTIGAGKFGGALFTPADSTIGGIHFDNEDLNLTEDSELQWELFFKWDGSNNSVVHPITTIFSGRLFRSTVSVYVTASGQILLNLIGEDGKWAHQLQSASSVVPHNVFKHIAITISSGVNKRVSVYVDGEEVLYVDNYTYDTEHQYGKGRLSLGRYPAFSMTGWSYYHDELRVCRKITYTENFSPPVAPFT